MTLKLPKKVRPDSKGRLPFGRYLAEGVSSYTVTPNDHGGFLLEPNIEIPASEKWLWENKTALNQVKKGLQDPAAGKVRSRGSFAKYVDDNEKE